MPCSKKSTWAAAADRRLDAYAAAMRSQWKALVADPRQGRRLVERLALALQGSLLVRFSPRPLADAFCASRLSDDGCLALGTLPSSAEVPKILERVSR